MTRSITAVAFFPVFAGLLVWHVYDRTFSYPCVVRICAGCRAVAGHFFSCSEIQVWLHCIEYALLITDKPPVINAIECDELAAGNCRC